jgi:hypothetical protein
MQNSECVVELMKKMSDNELELTLLKGNKVLLKRCGDTGLFYQCIEPYIHSGPFPSLTEEDKEQLALASKCIVKFGEKYLRTDDIDEDTMKKLFSFFGKIASKKLMSQDEFLDVKNITFLAPDFFEIIDNCFPNYVASGMLKALLSL